MHVNEDELYRGRASGSGLLARVAQQTRLCQKRRGAKERKVGERQSLGNGTKVRRERRDRGSEGRFRGKDAKLREKE